MERSPTSINADVSPSGQVCAGRWNRTTTAAWLPYTTCIPTGVSEVATMTGERQWRRLQQCGAGVHPSRGDQRGAGYHQ